MFLNEIKPITVLRQKNIKSLYRLQIANNFFRKKEGTNLTSDHRFKGPWGLKND